jgi:hypothetical protein
MESKIWRRIKIGDKKKEEKRKGKEDGEEKREADSFCHFQSDHSWGLD